MMMAIIVCWWRAKRIIKNNRFAHHPMINYYARIIIIIWFLFIQAVKRLSAWIKKSRRSTLLIWMVHSYRIIEIVFPSFVLFVYFSSSKRRKNTRTQCVPKTKNGAIFSFPNRKHAILITLFYTKNRCTCFFSSSWNSVADQDKAAGVSIALSLPLQLLFSISRLNCCEYEWNFFWQVIHF